MISGTALGADYYVDPENGSASGDGSAASPWETLEEVVSSGLFGSTVTSGDTVHLLSGYHGELNLSSGEYDPPITIVEDAGQIARLRRARFNHTSGWVLDGVSISPSHAPSYATVTMVEVGDGAYNVTVQNCEIFSVADASGWGVSDWLDVASSGVRIAGTDVIIRNNLIRNVRFGINVDGDAVLIDNNSVVNFSADGLRGIGDDNTFQYNVVKNSYLDDEVDDNHDDGFQSWSVGPGGVGTGEVSNMVLRGNVIINAEDPAQPMKGTLQGIGCFDGTFVNWVVENNVVITNHWHGISLYGVRDSRVVNNTVIDNEGGTPGPPWISVRDHKDGTPSEDTIVRNNLTTDLDVTGNNVTEDHNAILADGDLASYFVDAAAWDLHLLETAPAVDQGSAELAPTHDADGIPRPQGAGIDLGAFEWHEPGLQPEGGSAGAGGGAFGGSGGASRSGGAAAEAAAEDAGGCGCRTAPGRGSSMALLLATLALVAPAWRRRSFEICERREFRRRPR